MFFPVHQLLSKDEARARILRPDATPGSPSDAMGSDLHDDELTPYPDEDNGDSWYLADVTGNSHVNVRTSLRREFYAIRKLCGSAKAAAPEDGSSVLILALQNLNATTERDSAVTAKTWGLVTCKLR